MDKTIKVDAAMDTVPHVTPPVLSKETLELMDRVRRDIDVAMNSLVFEHTVDRKAEVYRTSVSWLMPIASDVA